MVRLPRKNRHLWKPATPTAYQIEFMMSWAKFLSSKVLPLSEKVQTIIAYGGHVHGRQFRTWANADAPIFHRINCQRAMADALRRCDSRQPDLTAEECIRLAYELHIWPTRANAPASLKAIASLGEHLKLEHLLKISKYGLQDVYISGSIASGFELNKRLLVLNMKGALTIARFASEHGWSPKKIEVELNAGRKIALKHRTAAGGSLFEIFD